MGQKTVLVFDPDSPQTFVILAADRAEFEAKCVSAGFEIRDSGCSCGKCGLVFIPEDKFVPVTDADANLFGALPQGMNGVKVQFGSSFFYTLDLPVLLQGAAALMFKVYEETTL